MKGSAKKTAARDFLKAICPLLELEIKLNDASKARNAAAFIPLLSDFFAAQPVTLWTGT